MSVQRAGALVPAGSIHLAVGVLLAVPFVLNGVGQIDPAAREGTWGFRLLVRRRTE